MPVIPYLSQGQGVVVDPRTGLPMKKKAAPKQQNPWGGAGNPSGFAVPGLPGSSAAGGAGAPGSGGGGPMTIPAFTPDYGSLINQALAPLQAQLGAEGVADAGSRNAQMIRALGQFGRQFDAGSAQQAFGSQFFNESGLGEVLPQANELARQTTDAGVSFQARSMKSHKDAIRQIRNMLAARGALRSGELGHQLQEQQGQFDTAQYDAASQVQDFLSAIQAGYVQAQRARQAQLDAARREEAPRQAALNPASGSRQVFPGDPDYPVQPPAPLPFAAPQAQAPVPAQRTSEANLTSPDPLAELLRRVGAGPERYRKL